MLDFCNSTSSAVPPDVNPLVVIVDRHGERFFGPLLPDHVLIEDVIDLFGFGNIAQPQSLVDVFVELFFDDLVTELDTFIANVHARPGDEFTHLLLRFSAKAAFELTLVVSKAEHRASRFPLYLTPASAGLCDFR